ncbi:MAG: hypothetical protein JWM61_29 [Micrococcaceae bacterium]|jgi:hypothetical protein|nr:hypothetical protein [Micrococcaceae bacterium]
MMKSRPSPTDAVGAWQPCDESVSVTFKEVDGEVRPQRLSWRGAEWCVVGCSRHWFTWHALPVLSVDTRSNPTVRGFRTDFWRFQATADAASPVLRFEVRRADREWRLVRLGAPLPCHGGTSGECRTSDELPTDPRTPRRRWEAPEQCVR